MKYLIYGGNGWIGNMMCSILKERNIDFVIGTERVDNDKKLEEEIFSVNPTHIMCFIGRTHGVYNNEKIGTIDYLEKPGKLVDNIRDNLFSPIVLSLISKKYNIHLTYLGTGCIFSQDENEIEDSNGYNEDSNPDFFGSSYSIVKGFTDRLMHHLDSNVLNLRIRMPIVNYSNPRNFITKITKYEKICSIHNSMTYLPELLPIALDLSIKKTTGTVNLTNPGTITHNEILELFKKYVQPSFEWKNFNIEEQNKILLSKRSNNKLNTKKLKELYPNVLNIKDAVEECLKNYQLNI